MCFQTAFRCFFVPRPGGRLKSRFGRRRGFQTAFIAFFVFVRRLHRQSDQGNTITDALATLLSAVKVMAKPAGQLRVKTRACLVIERHGDNIAQLPPPGYRIPVKAQGVVGVTITEKPH